MVFRWKGHFILWPNPGPSLEERAQSSCVSMWVCALRCTWYKMTNIWLHYSGWAGDSPEKAPKPSPDRPFSCTGEGPGGLRGSQRWITTKATLLPGWERGGRWGSPKALVLGFGFLSSFLRTPLRPGTCAWLRGASVAGQSSCWCDHGLPSSLSRAGASAAETGQLAVSITYLFLLVFHVTFLKKQTEQL